MAAEAEFSYTAPDGEGAVWSRALSEAGREYQIAVMKVWFHENYEDPVENTPYESAEGGYIYIWGGPYDALEEIQQEFSGTIPDDVIEQLADELNDISAFWAGKAQYDDYIYEAAAASSEHRRAFEQSMGRIEALLDLDIPPEQQQHLFRLLYANVITAIETYLSDLFISAIEKDPHLKRRFVETTPDFQKEKFAFSMAYAIVEEVEARVRAQLLKVVWHRIDAVQQMFRDTLGIPFPEELGGLFAAILIRHDLVHRNGKSPDGLEHDINRTKIGALIEVARSLITHIDDQWLLSQNPADI